MYVATKLHKSLEEVLNLTMLELDLWAGYFKIEVKNKNREMRKQRGAKHRR
jgi:hypothetical protein